MNFNKKITKNNNNLNDYDNNNNDLCNTINKDSEYASVLSNQNTNLVNKLSSNVNENNNTINSKENIITKTNDYYSIEEDSSEDDYIEITQENLTELRTSDENNFDDSSSISCNNSSLINSNIERSNFYKEQTTDKDSYSEKSVEEKDSKNNNEDSSASSISKEDDNQKENEKIKEYIDLLQIEFPDFYEIDEVNFKFNFLNYINYKNKIKQDKANIALKYKKTLQSNKQKTNNNNFIRKINTDESFNNKYKYKYIYNEEMYKIEDKHYNFLTTELEQLSIDFIKLSKFKIDENKTLTKTKDIIYNAEFIDNQRKCICKKIKIKNNLSINIIINEIKIINTLKHLNYFKLIGYSLDKTKNYFYILFEHENEMQDLLKFIIHNHNVQDKFKIIVNLLKFVLDIHSNGIIHRDLRYESFFITNNLDIKCFDYYNAVNTLRIKRIIMFTKKYNDYYNNNKSISNKNLQHKVCHSINANVTSKIENNSNNSKKVNLINNIDVTNLNSSIDSNNNYDLLYSKDSDNKTSRYTFKTKKSISSYKLHSNCIDNNITKFSNFNDSDENSINSHFYKNTLNYDLDFFYSPKFVSKEIGMEDPLFGWPQDIYALACILLVILIDYTKYDEISYKYIIYRTFYSDTNSIQERIPTYISIDIAKIVFMCLEINPLDRIDILEIINKFNIYFKFTNTSKQNLEINITEEQKSSVKKLKDLNFLLFKIKDKYIIKEEIYKNNTNKLANIKSIKTYNEDNHKIILKNSLNLMENLKLHKEDPKYWDVLIIEKDNQYDICIKHDQLLKFFCENCKDFKCIYCLKVEEDTGKKHNFKRVGYLLPTSINKNNIKINQMKECFLDANFLVLSYVENIFNKNYESEKQNIISNYNIILEKVEQLKQKQLQTLEDSKNHFLKNGFEELFKKSQEMLSLYYKFYDTKQSFEAINIRLLNSFRDRRILYEEYKIKKNNINFNINNKHTYANKYYIKEDELDNSLLDNINDNNRLSNALYTSDLNNINFNEFLKKFELFEEYSDLFKKQSDYLLNKVEQLKMPGKYIFRSEQYTNEITQYIKAIESRINLEKHKTFDYYGNDILQIPNEILMIVPITNIVLSYKDNSFKKIKIEFEENKKKINKFLPGSATLQFNKSLIVTGGEINDEGTIYCYSIDIQSKYLVEIADMNTKRRYHSIINLFDRFIVVVGGWGNKEVEAIDLKDKKSNYWLNLPSMHNYRSDASLYLFNERYLYVFGGWEHEKKECVYEVERLDILVKNSKYYDISYQSNSFIGDNNNSNNTSVQNNYHKYGNVNKDLSYSYSDGFDMVYKDKHWEYVKIASGKAYLQKYNMALLPIIDLNPQLPEQILLLGGYDEIYDYSQSIVQVNISLADGSINVDKDRQCLPVVGDRNFWFEKDFKIMTIGEKEKIAVNFNCFNQIYVFYYSRDTFKVFKSLNYDYVNKQKINC